MLSRSSQRCFVRRASPLAPSSLAPSTSTRLTRYAPGGANGLQQTRGIGDLALFWTTCIFLPAVVQGWSPVPVKRNPLAAHDVSGDLFNKPKDAPPGWLPRPAFWQPGMPEIPFLYNLIPPREGFRQWQSWEASYYYMYGLMAFAYYWFFVSDRYSTDKQGEYWLMRVATDYIPPTSDLPPMNPFDVLDEGAHRSIWHDRYAMSFWAARFKELSPERKEYYWKNVSQYIESREEFQQRVDMVLGDAARVDMEALSFGFIDESNAFIDQLKMKVMNRIALHARGDIPGQGHEYWKWQIQSLEQRRLDSPTRIASTKSKNSKESDEDAYARMRSVYDAVEKAWYERTKAWLSYQEWRATRPA